MAREAFSVWIFDPELAAMRRPVTLAEALVDDVATTLSAMARTFGVAAAVEPCDGEEVTRWRLTCTGAERPIRVIVGDSGVAVPGRHGLARSLARFIDYELCGRGLTRVAARVLALALDDIDEARAFASELDEFADLASALRLLSGTSGPPTVAEPGEFDRGWKGVLAGWKGLAGASSTRRSTPLLASVEWDLGLAGGPRPSPAAVAARVSAAGEALQHLATFAAPWVPDGVREGIGELGGRVAAAAEAIARAEVR